ncbi:MAG: adenylate/guanylate cyclase domain-containing protein [Planctomycetaceae bacterium]
MNSAFLSYRVGGQDRRFYLDRDVVRIGRGDRSRGMEMDLAIDGSVRGVSRYHATLKRIADQWWIFDGDGHGTVSRNGTYLDGELVREAELHEGCVIALGEVLFHFHLELPSDSSSTQRKLLRDTPHLATRAPDLAINMEDLSISRSSGNMPQADLSRSDSGSGRQGNTQQVRAVGVFSELGQALQVARTLEELLETVLQVVLTHIHADSVAVLDWNPEKNEYRSLLHRSLSPEAERRPVSRTLLGMAITSRQTMCWSDTGELRQATERPSLMESVAVICAPLWRQNRVRGALYLDTLRVLSFGPPQTEMASAIALFTAVALDLFEQREQVRQQHELRKKLEQYMQVEVVEELINQGLGGDLMLATQAEVTVLFGDLRGFTALSEKRSPAEVVQLLNEVFGRMVEVIFRHGGTLDKFMGDGIMVYFGHPRAHADHAVLAVRAGLEMQAALAEFNRQQPPDQQIQIRIGINSGPVVAGDIGGAGRKDYTVIGNTVNVASRFESQVAKPGEVVIGPETRQLVGPLFHCEPLPGVQLKGKSETIIPYRVFGPLNA